ncbi:chemotaxis protein CheW [Criblamydia sequanensis]|uniref:Chemotaxis protein CheW n=1 Tax=Candidatus Criblamydia sequanensis CRIB-18 TaxID=1437425 RepID=A0A090D1H7_9BACT|nr:chemotaxis protein CheW [Criblamydia sequanensis]CDR33830.1 Chemotaxis signal transduction protein [Criblamydia sequanensis CRIB-18]
MSKQKKEEGASSKNLFSKQLTEAFLQEFTLKVKEKEEASFAPHQISYFIFKLQTKWFGLKAHIIQEVLNRRSTHSIPFRPSPVLKGIINVSGQLKIYIDLETVLGLEADKQNKNDKNIKFILIGEAPSDWVFSSYEVLGVFEISEEKIKASSEEFEFSHYLLGKTHIDKNEVFLIDETKLLESLSLTVG